MKPAPESEDPIARLDQLVSAAPEPVRPPQPPAMALYWDAALLNSPPVTAANCAEAVLC